MSPEHRAKIGASQRARLSRLSPEDRELTSRRKAAAMRTYFDDPLNYAVWRKKVRPGQRGAKAIAVEILLGGGTRSQAREAIAGLCSTENSLRVTLSRAARIVLERRGARLK